MGATLTKEGVRTQILRFHQRKATIDLAKRTSSLRSTKALVSFKENNRWLPYEYIAFAKNVFINEH